MKSINRREAILTLSSASSALLLGATAGEAAETTPQQTRMGIVTYAFGIHLKNRWAGRHEGLSPALALLEESHDLGAAGIQIDLGAQDTPRVTELRRRAESYGMYIEASVAVPKSVDDVERFEEDIRTAKAAGATLARTVILPGRRYETFDSLEQFKKFADDSWRALRRVEAPAVWPRRP